MVGQTISHYRIVEKLGEGGMGIVYAAEDTRLGRRVAIKFLTASDQHQQRARFLREARALSEFSHPHIAAIYDYGETDDGQPFIVMEMIKGRALSDILGSGPLELDRALEVASDVAEALGEAHRHGIIHRDIKPSNVIIDERGMVKVLDFGLAKAIQARAGDAVDTETRTLIGSQTLSGVVVGTPLYLSPEQARGAPVDARSDIFALGILLYECLTGAPPFPGPGALEVIGQILHVDPRPPSALNHDAQAEVDRITLKALAKLPAARYQSAEEMLSDLRHARERQGASSESQTQTLPRHDRTIRPGASQTIRDALRRPRVVVPSILVVVLALGGLAALWALWGVPQSKAQRWYDEGTNALRNGAYYQASMALENAVKADPGFALGHARLAEAYLELDNKEKASAELLQVHSLVSNRLSLPQSDRLYIEAITAIAGADYAGAIEKYKKIAELMPDHADVYLDLGRAYEKNNDFAGAILNYEKAAKGDPEYATAFLRLGILYGRQRDARSAESFKRAEDIFAAHGNAEGRAEVCYQRGVILRSAGSIAEAREQLQKAHDLAALAGNEPQQVLALLQLSGIAYLENNVAQAQQFASDAVALAQAKGLENITARGLVDLGNAYNAKGDIPQAEKYFRQSLEFSQIHRDRRNEARALLSLGALLTKKGATDEGLQDAQRALDFYRQGNYRREASLAETVIGRAERQRGNYEAALKAFSEQLEFATQSDDKSQLALAHEGLGTVLAEQGDFPGALDHFTKEYENSSASANERSKGYSLVNRANMLWQLGRYGEAAEAFGRVAALASQPGGGYQGLLATLYQYEADEALSQLQYAKAKASIQRALDTAGTPDTELAVESKRILSVAEVFSGEKGAALQSLEEAIDLANRSGDPWLISRALLSSAEVLLESGNAARAQALALQALEVIQKSGSQEAEWQAWTLASAAAKRAGDQDHVKEYALRAPPLFETLRQRWGEEALGRYFSRRDIERMRAQLNAMLR